MVLLIVAFVIIGITMLWYSTAAPAKVMPFPQHWHAILTEEVDFYNRLPEEKKQRFRLDMMKFLATVDVVGVGCEIEDLDRVLIAAGATITLFGFSTWSLNNLESVFVYAGPVNRRFQVGAPDSRYAGLVGNGPMQGKLVLSKPDLRHGFTSSNDRRNVAIHEFAHLVDGQDGSIAGFPAGSIADDQLQPWVELMRIKGLEIEDKQSDIRPYALTNSAEFFAVASEYFFEAPERLKSRHPQIYEFLSEAYDQDPATVLTRRGKRKIQVNQPCPCGSGEKFKECCLPLVSN